MTKPAITTRLGKGEPLTFSEMDTNLENLQNSTITVSDGSTSTAVSLNGGITIAGGNGISVTNDGNGSFSIDNTQTQGITSVAGDTTPQLGGNLDVNGNSIVSVSNGNISITPNGTGSIVLDGLNWPQADGTDKQVLTTNGAGQLVFGSVSYNDLTNQPSLFSGSYTDLTNKPTIPSDTGDLTNGAGFITTSALSGYATESYVSTAVSNLVDSAPGTLDTLNELAAALGDDPNFATTVTTSLGNKLEDITNESIGDLSDVDLTGIADGQGLIWDSANSKFVPDTGNLITGSVTDIDAVRTPNTITLSNYTGISTSDEITFAGTDATSAGVTIGTVYYINAEVSPGVYEIKDNTMNNITFTDIGTITDFTYTVTPAGGNSGNTLDSLSDVDTAGATSGQVLKYNGTSWQASSAPTQLSNDTNPQLGGDLDVGSFQIKSTNADGDVVLTPGGTGTTYAKNFQYYESIYDLGSTDSPSINVETNGNVQKVSISSGLTFSGFSSAQAGQSVTLVVTGSGTMSGTGSTKFAGGATTLTSYSLVSIFYDGSTYWCSINTDFQ